MPLPGPLSLLAPAHPWEPALGILENLLFHFRHSVFLGRASSGMVIRAGGGISRSQCSFSGHGFGMMDRNREYPKVPMKSHRLCRGATFPRKLTLASLPAVPIYEGPVMCKALTHSCVLMEVQSDAMICPILSSRKVAAQALEPRTFGHQACLSSSGLQKQVICGPVGRDFEEAPLTAGAELSCDRSEQLRPGFPKLASGRPWAAREPGM